MDRFAKELYESCGVVLATQFESKAIYYRELDFIEYLADDCFAISDRIDEHLTVIKDGDSGELVGFKLKGIEFIFNDIVKPVFGERVKFMKLVDVFQVLVGQIADASFKELRDRRTKAYQEVAQLISQKELSLPEDMLKVA